MNEQGFFKIPKQYRYRSLACDTVLFHEKKGTLSRPLKISNFKLLFVSQRLGWFCVDEFYTCQCADDYNYHKCTTQTDKELCNPHF